MGNKKTNLVVKDKILVKTPSFYNVLLLNDDKTTMDFVVHILELIFLKSSSEAVRIMLEVHNKGSAICGTYPKEIAESKCQKVSELALANGFPLKAIFEKLN